uniref:HAT C-terminal dimerisation domain-containing protein n=1 Tax=Latimeria chalumnae TaxID=7897 RepID=H2ZWI3_LATCH
MQQWKELSIRLNTETLTTIDAHGQRMRDMEQLHWRAVLDQIIAIVQFWAERNALCGNVNWMFEPHNSNFLEQVELMAKYGTVMAEHLRRIQSDCTSDISCTEQLSVCMDTINISEHFMGFLNVNDTTGGGLTNFLEGARYQGGLIIYDAAHSSQNAISFFGYLQKIYMFCAASTHQWETLCKYCKLTPKPLGDTHWECKVDNTKVLRLESEIRDLAKKKEKDGVAFTEAQGFANEVRSFRFLICLVIWHEILTEINRISKYLQDPKVQIGTALDMIDAAQKFLTNYHKNGFEETKCVATELADSLGIHPEFPLQHKRSFDYESGDEPIHSSTADFKVDFFFYRLVDVALSSLDLMEKHDKLFGFLYNIKDLEGIDTDHLNKQCMDLQLALTGTEEVSDVDGINLVNKVHSLSKILPTNSTASLDALHYTHKSGLEKIYPNVSVALTVPVTVASSERSFSKLKLIKSYLRSNMSQEQLRGLVLISTEHAIRKTLDYSKLIKAFAAAKSHKATFV